MKAMIYINTQSFGNTQKSLAELSYALRGRFSKIVVGRAKTNDISCSFVVFASGFDEPRFLHVHVTGDGFRTDGSGEGGRGYHRAMEMLQEQGIELIELPEMIYSPRQVQYEGSFRDFVSAYEAQVKLKVKRYCLNVLQNEQALRIQWPEGIEV